jgi:ketosteroid isomerase-like protein
MRARAADTLYAPEALVVANVLVDYRWINSERNQAEAGRATFVCEQKPKGWRIVHVHSSQILPRDR